MGRLFLLRRPSYDDPEYWRKGAQKLRDLAAQIDDKELKEQALHVADESDAQANKAQQLYRATGRR
jgi:hypothetical protein